jgi:hypothetical protein
MAVRGARWTVVTFISSCKTGKIMERDQQAQLPAIAPSLI